MAVLTRIAESVVMVQYKNLRAHFRLSPIDAMTIIRNSAAMSTVDEVLSETGCAETYAERADAANTYLADMSSGRWTEPE